MAVHDRRVRGASRRIDPAEYVEAVLELVERIPPGRVMSYGAIAEYLYDRFGRGSARRVGTIMAQYGGPVPWHRVVSGGGRLPPATRSRRAAGSSRRVSRSAAHGSAWPTTRGGRREARSDRTQMPRDRRWTAIDADPDVPGLITPAIMGTEHLARLVR